MTQFHLSTIQVCIPSDNSVHLGHLLLIVEGSEPLNHILSSFDLDVLRNIDTNIEYSNGRYCLQARRNIV
jgi:hypothetical protein